MPDLRAIIKRFYPVILLFMVVALSADLLSFSDILTGPVLAQRKQETILAKLEEIFPDTTQSGIINDVYVATADSKPIGYGFITTGMGVGGQIETLVILENESTVKAIFVIKQTETPGLGSLITEQEFTDQFVEQMIEDIKHTTEGGKIDWVTGATISSRVVTDSVRKAALEQAKALPSAEEIQAALTEAGKETE